MSCTPCAASANLAERTRTQAALCASCLHAGGDWPALTTCTIDAKTLHPPTRLAIGCPKGQSPDERGIVRVRGVAFVGVPRWRRLIWPALRKARAPLPGCGCFLALLNLRDRLAAIARRLSGRS